MRVRTSLQDHVQSGRGPDDEKRVCRLRLAAYRERRVAVIHLDEIRNPFDRQNVENIVKQQLGISQ